MPTPPRQSLVWCGTRTPSPTHATPTGGGKKIRGWRCGQPMHRCRGWGEECGSQPSMAGDGTSGHVPSWPDKAGPSSLEEGAIAHAVAEQRSRRQHPPSPVPPLPRPWAGRSASPQYERSRPAATPTPHRQPSGPWPCRLRLARPCELMLHYRGSGRWACGHAAAMLPL